MVFTACAPSGGAAKETAAVEQQEAAPKAEEKKEEKKEEIVLTYITCQVGADASAEVVQKTVDKFNELHKGEIRVVIDGVPEYTNQINKVKTNISSGIPIDITYLSDLVTRDDYWGRGQWADLTPYIDDEMKAQDTENNWKECTTVDGEIVGVPSSMMSEAIYYNKTLFAKAGIEESEIPFKTWDAFYEACDKLKAAGITPLSQQTAGGNGWCSMLFYSAFVGGARADILKDIHSFDDPIFEEGAEMLLKLRDYTTPDALNGAYEMAAINFLQGNTAMIANGPWMTAQLKENPELWENLGLMPFPSQDGTGTIVNAGPCFMLMTSKENEKDPEKMKAIVEFMKFQNDPAVVKDLILESGLMYTYAGEMDLASSDKLDYLQKEYFRLIEEANYTINDMSNGVVAEFSPAFCEELGKLWMDQITPAEFVANMDARCFGAK